VTAGLFLVVGSAVLWDGSGARSDTKALRCLLGRWLPGMAAGFCYWNGMGGLAGFFVEFPAVVGGELT